MRISVDPASAAPLANDPVFLDRIKPIDLLLPNRDEADVLGPQIDVPELVITQGADGATWTDGIETVERARDPARRRRRHHRRGRRVRGRVPVRLARRAAGRAGGRRAARGARGDPARWAPVTRVLFVCMGNICRSPTAEGVMRSLVREAGLEHEIEIDSAGVGDWHAGDPPDRRATEAARARGDHARGRGAKGDPARLRGLRPAARRRPRERPRPARGGARRNGDAKIRLLREFDPASRRRARPRRPRPVLRRPARVRDGARPGRGRLPRPAR